MKRLLTTTAVMALVRFFAIAQCTSLNIHVDKSYQCAPGVVTFITAGAPQGSSYLWDFGNGYVTNTDTVHEFFIRPQVVDVKVKVTFPNGNQCVVELDNATKILGKPNPTFEISRTKLCDGPDTVTVTNLTPNTKQISWIVDGTNYFNAQNTLVHKFKSEGSKDLSMVVVDSFGCSNVKQFENIAIVHPDVDLDFSADQTSGCVSKQVQITPTVNNHGEKITSTVWDFPGSDLSKYTGEVPPTLNYMVSGMFDVSLRVQTANGCTHQYTKSDYLHFGDSLTIKLDLDNPTVCLGSPKTLKIKNAKSTGNYTWSLDKDVDTSHISNSELTAIFPREGTYSVSIELVDGGCYSKSVMQNAISVKRLKADFASKDNYHCYTPHTTHIDNKTNCTTGGMLMYTWNIYNGTNVVYKANTANIGYKSNEWGRYGVELIARDQFGCADTMFKDQFIRVDSIRPMISSEERIGCVDQVLDIKSGTPPSSYISKDTFYWVLYDLDGKTEINKGSGYSIKQSFSKPGKYDVKLYAGNSIGCVDSIDAKQFIEIIEPVKDFSFPDSTICIGDKFKVEAQTSPSYAPFTYAYTIVNSKDSRFNFRINPTQDRSSEVLINAIGTYDVSYTHQIRTGCKDTLTKKASFFVNGVKGTLNLDNDNGCLPFNVNPFFKIEENAHVGNASNELEYKWWATPSTGVVIKNANAKNPGFIFNERGIYRINVLVTNSSGCVYSVVSDTIYAGVKADIGIDRKQLCANEEIEVLDLSSLRPTSTKWNVISKSPYTLSVDSVARFTPSKTDDYTIELIASKFNQCFDTARVNVTAIQVVSEFQVIDTHVFCAPAYAQINTTSIYADTFFYDFGDGTQLKSTDRQIAHIYQRNSGFDEGFEVTLISKSKLGCSDTFSLTDAIRVFGPIPEFGIDNFKGCEPLKVNFTDKSRYVATYKLNFDDNSDLDSSRADHHTYRVQTTQKMQNFIPSLYVEDSLGCAAVFESPDTVTVLKKAEAVPSDMEIKGCSPVQVALKDQSLDVTTRTWLLNDVVLSNDSAINPLISIPGNHHIQLIVNNENNCPDTSEFDVLVHKNPTPELTVEGLACMNQVIQAKTASALYKTWTWNSTADSTSVQTTLNEHLFTFTAPGKQAINVEVTDSNGCSATTSIDVNVMDKNDIPGAVITYVTFNDDNKIEVNWDVVNNPNVHKTILTDNNNNTILYTEQVNRDLSYTSSSSVPTCYVLHHTNMCGDQGAKSSAHCPVVVDVRANRPFELDLTWSPYAGWEHVYSYTIMRCTEGSAFVKIGEVDGETLTFVDKGLCDQTYTYRIIANNKSVQSRSNMTSAKPIYKTVVLPTNIKVATVENNEFVSVQWDSAEASNVTNYRLTKYDITGQNVINQLEINSTQFIDEEVDVNEEAYIYKVQTVDHCGLIGVEGLKGKPIILTATFENNMSMLSWTPYDGWFDGVQTYDIQLKFDNVFKTIGTVDGGTTHFESKDFYDQIKGEYVYRIVAHSFNAEVTSTSNYASVIGNSIVWIPNAFSPGEDDLNNTFKPTTHFVSSINNGAFQTFEMAIYNRWGELVYRTNDLHDGWDGAYMNKPCQSGNYMYHIRVKGIDKQIYNVKGIVWLMR